MTTSPTCPDVVDALRRREFLAILAASGLLTGCGSRDEDGTSDDPGTGTVTVTDQRGVDVSLEAPPARVLSVADGQDLQNLIALGVEPIAWGAYTDRPTPWLQDRLDTATRLDIGSTPNLVSIAELAPDLIVSSWYDDAIYDELEAIAPLYMVDFASTWRQQLRALGTLLSRPTQAQAALARAEEAIAEGRKRLRGLDGLELALVHVYDPGGAQVDVWTSASPVGELLVELGLAPLRQPEEPGSPTAEISRELVGDITGDRLVVLDFSFDDDSLTRATQELLDSDLGQLIPARQGGVVRLSTAASHGINLMTAACVPFLVEELVSQLLP